jgi:LuxR family maltose regulon positive regulatory protein
LRAPTGFGKTALVSQWLKQRPDLRAVWLTLGQDSSGGDAFWEAMLDALIESGADLAWAEGARSYRGRVRRVLRAMSSGVVLVLDRFELAADDGLEDQLLELVRVSPGLRVIVCTRDHRQFSRHGVTIGNLSAITASRLLFTKAEVGRLLERFGADAARERIAIICDETACWPGLTLAVAQALSVQAAEGPGGQSDVDVIGRVVGRWFADVALDELPGSGTFDSVLAISLAEELTADLAATLSGVLSGAGSGAGAQEVLATLERQGMLRASVEAGETLYSWRSALRRAFASRLARQDPAQARRLHTVVARWYLDRGQAERAIEHAVAAEEWALVVEIVERHWRGLLMLHRDTLFTALIAAPLDELASSPRALAVRDLRLQMPDDRILTAVPELPSDAEALRRLGEAPDTLDTLETGLAMILALRRRGMLEPARRLSGQVEEVAASAKATRGAEVMPHLPGILGQTGGTRLKAGDLVGAVRPLRWAFEHASEAPLDYVARDASGKLALVFALEGDVEQAELWLRRYESSPAVAGWAQVTTSNAAITARIMLALDRLELADAFALARGRGDHLGTDEMWGFTVYASAQVALYRGAPSDGLAQIEQARRDYEQWHRQGSAARPLLAAAEAELLLSSGRFAEAAAVLEGPDREHRFLRVPRARLALLSRDPDAVVQLFADRPLHGSRRELLDLQVLEALALSQVGEGDAAVRTLAAALAAAEPGRLLRPFVGVPSRDLAVLAERVGDQRTELLRAQPLVEVGEVFPGRPPSERRRSRRPGADEQLWTWFDRLIEGDFSETASALSEIVEQSRGRSDRQAAIAAGGAALANAMVGDIAAAAALLRSAPTPPEPGTRLETAGTVAYQTAALLVAVAHLDTRRADQALNAVRELPLRQLQSLSAFAVAEHGLVFARPVEALHEFEMLLAKPREHRYGGVGALLGRAVSAELMLAAGLGNRARALLRGRERTHSLLGVALARMQLLAGRLEQALAIATQTLWQPGAIPRARLNALVILATAEARLGRDPEAREHLEQAATMVERYQLLSPLACAPRDLVVGPVATPLIPDLTSKVGAWPEVFPAAIDLVELTRREREVLHALADGLDATTIASRFVVSVTTVRSQIQSIYRKLGVHSRDDAIAQASRWGLLESLEPAA